MKKAGIARWLQLPQSRTSNGTGDFEPNLDVEIEECPNCKLPVRAGHVRSSQAFATGESGLSIRLFWMHNCGLTYVTDMTTDQYEELIRLIERGQPEEGEPQEGEPRTREWDDLPRSEQIGRLVQGFRIEMDVVETLADIPNWERQERREPWAIPKEAL